MTHVFVCKVIILIVVMFESEEIHNKENIL